MLPMETEMKLLFPTVMRYKPNETRFVGIFKTQQNENVFASFNIPNYPTSLGITFETGITIEETIYQNLIFKSDNLTFLEFLKMFSQVIASAPKQRVFNRQHFSRFHDEFRDLKHIRQNEDYVFDENTETLTIINTDEYSVANKIVVKINFYTEGYELYEVVEHNLPEMKDIILFQKHYSLYLLQKQFSNFVDDLGPFHDIMQKIDSVCWVVAPTNPTFEHEYRTIIIADNVSMKVMFNPWRMCDLPEFRFFGPSKLIKKYKDNLSENLSHWDSQCEVLQNILKVLDLPFFPVRPVAETTSEAEVRDMVLYDSESECCVCFSNYLNDEPPALRCDNECCRRYFHQECLYEWLSRLPNKIYFGSVSGPCPNCEKTISCKVPEK